MLVVLGLASSKGKISVSQTPSNGSNLVLQCLFLLAGSDERLSTL